MAVCVEKKVIESPSPNVDGLSRCWVRHTQIVLMSIGSDFVVMRLDL